jgi:hypothetical protein
MPSQFVRVRARRSSSRTAIPSSGTHRRQLSHIAMEISQGPEPPPAPFRVVRCGSRCSASLSNSMVKATSANESKAGSGRRLAMDHRMPLRRTPGKNAALSECCAAPGRLISTKTATPPEGGVSYFSLYDSNQSVDSISKPHASSSDSGMYFEFRLRRAHSRSRVERMY